jgi:hypothetical protein
VSRFGSGFVYHSADFGGIIDGAAIDIQDDVAGLQSASAALFDGLT